MEQWRKAIIGALIAGFAAAVPVVQDGTVTLADWCIIAGAILVGFNGVYWTPNAKEPTPNGWAPNDPRG